MQIQKPKTVQKLLAFPCNPAGTRNLGPQSVMHWTADPQDLFRPMGLQVWGATNVTLINDIRIGQFTEGTVNAGSIPAKFFEAGHSFAELENLAEQGKLDLVMPQRQRLKMRTAEVGHRITVVTQGPFESFAMWGLVPDPSRGFQAYARIEKIVEPASTEPGGDVGRTYYRGQVIAHDLDDEEYFPVTIEAPTSADTAVVLASQIGSMRMRY